MAPGEVQVATSTQNKPLWPPNSPQVSPGGHQKAQAGHRHPSVSPAGCEGRCGMAAVRLKAGTTFDGRSLYAFTRETLPAYAAPRFVRLQVSAAPAPASPRASRWPPGGGPLPAAPRRHWSPCPRNGATISLWARTLLETGTMTLGSPCAAGGGHLAGDGDGGGSHLRGDTITVHPAPRLR